MRFDSATITSHLVNGTTEISRILDDNLSITDLDHDVIDNAGEAMFKAYEELDSWDSDLTDEEKVYVASCGKAYLVYLKKLANHVGITFEQKDYEEIARIMGVFCQFEIA